jgi:hypothetical protein
MIRTIILVGYGLLLLTLSLRSLRAQRLKERYVLLFTLTGLPFLVLAMWPDGIVFLSDVLEIEKPTLLVLALAAFLILIIFELFSIVSVQERRITSLAQHVGILLQERRLTDRDATAARHTSNGDDEGDNTAA